MPVSKEATCRLGFKQDAWLAMLLSMRSRKLQWIECHV